MPYILVRWLATGEDGGTNGTTLNEPKSAGDTSSWAGPAVLSTEVTIFVSVEDGEGNTAQLSASTSYTVEARDWKLTIEQRPRIEEVGNDTLRYPPTNDGSFDGVFAKVELWPSAPEVGQIVAAPTGPNALWAYVRDPLPPTDPVAYINKGLNPEDPFYKAQDGRRIPGGRFHCSGKDLDEIRARALEHEGAVPRRAPGPPSHYDIWVQQLPMHNLGNDLEGLHAHVSDMPSLEQFRARVSRTNTDWINLMNQKQKSPDTDKLQITCVFNTL